MAHRLRALILAVLVASSLACQAVYRAVVPIPASGPKIAAHTLQVASATPTVEPSLTSVPDTPTSLPVTPTAISTPELTPTRAGQVTQSVLQMRVFEHLWKTIRDEYLYPDFNGLDWDAVGAEYRQLVEAGLNDEEFYAAMSEMVFGLGDEHSSYLSPEDVLEEETEFAGEKEYGGIGVLTTAVEERERVTVIVVFPNSPAEEAGLQPHDSILEVEGLPVLEGDIDRRSLLRGEPGTQVEITVQTPGQEPRRLSLTRKEVLGSTPVPHTVLTTKSGKRVGYLLVVTFADDTIDEKIGEALEDLNAQGRLDGVILDNRQNTGGVDSVTRATLGYFTDGLVGHFTNRQGQRSFNIPGRDIEGSLQVPLVVLVGKNTVSFGEIFSGILQDIGRATLIGEQTDGNVEILWGFDFEDGSRAWIAHDTFRPLINPEMDWEETGIQPDETINSNWDEVTLDTDPAVQVALDRLDIAEPSAVQQPRPPRRAP